MHPNPIYRAADWGRALVAAQKRGFGVLTLAGPDGPLASHLPYVAEATTVDAHIVRSNPIARTLRDGPADALLVVSGPDGYVSPDWYGVEDQVPTWNYVAIHLRGPVELRPEQDLRGHLEQLSAANERNFLPKPPWTMDKNDPRTLERMMRMIVPIRMTVRTIESTWKLNQNKDDGVRLRAADAVETSPVGHNTGDLADLMRTWSDE